MDKFLLDELKAGNVRAFDKIFRDNYQNLCRYAKSIVHDSDSAQSLVQDVLIKFWDNRDKAGEIKVLVPYLITMVRNASFNLLKRNQRNLPFNSLSHEAISIPENDHSLDAIDFSEKLIIGLSSLPERCRTAFEYSLFENLTNREIGDKMGISTKGVEALITRSLKLLRVSLAEFLPSGNKKEKPGIILFHLFRKFKK